MSENLVLVEKLENVALLTLNRPEKGNALSKELLESLRVSIEQLKDDENIRCVVLKGSGQKGFSVGLDLAEMTGSSPEQVISYYGKGGPLRRAIKAVEGYPYPVVAMVHGYTVGAACELAIACDLRVGAESALMGMPPVRLGIVYPPEGIRRFIRTLGIPVTKKLFLTGHYFTASEARQMGMLDYQVPNEELQGSALGLAQKMAENAPLAMRGSKKLMGILIGPALPVEILEGEARPVMEEAFRSEDVAEALQAFADKRPPEFTGK